MCWPTTRRSRRSFIRSFAAFFRENAVEYFVSYYDYYQPEAYIASTDTYIEKESTINDEIDRLRLSATRSLFERRDVIIVASVSCIYGLGSPEAYYGMLLMLERGQRITRREICTKLVEILYERNDIDFKRGTFRVRGDTIEVHPTYENIGFRIELWGDEVDKLSTFDPLTGDELQDLDRLTIYPKSHFVMPRPDRTGRRYDQRRACRVGSAARTARPAARSSACSPADAVRHGNAQGSGLLPRHRELFASPDRPQCRVSRRRRCSIIFRRIR